MTACFHSQGVKLEDTSKKRGKEDIFTGKERQKEDIFYQKLIQINQKCI